MTQPFPLSGIAGIVADDPGELARANDAGLTAIEVRADLLLDRGHDADAVMGIVSNARARSLDCLVTLRHPTHGGAPTGSETERIELYRRALRAGAQAVDVEWGTEAARVLAAEGAPLILSHHDFDAMPGDRELASMTRAMTESAPLAIKIVPTAGKISEAVRMLEWVRQGGDGEPRRIGFAMGAAGAGSRILSIAYGAPMTYASLGDAVAPGQIPLTELVEVYRAAELDRDTRVYGIAGGNALSSFSPFLHNPALRAHGTNAVYVPFQTDDFDDLGACLDPLRVDGLSVTIPFKENALRLAQAADEPSRRGGASNTLVVTRNGQGREVRAFNTDVDGVLKPIERHTVVRDLKIAVIGNGGGARGAVAAFAGTGASVTLFYRTPSRGEPVARSLGVPGMSLEKIDRAFDVYINATPVGTHPEDPSPVPAEVFDRGRGQIAFDMVYLNPRTTFLHEAARAGATCISGGEMLIAQGIEQFKRFTGATPDEAVFQRGLERAFDLRVHR